MPKRPHRVARDPAEQRMSEMASIRTEDVALLMQVFHENRAMIAPINSKGDGHISFLGPMDVTREQAEAIDRLMAWSEEYVSPSEAEDV